MATLLFTAVGSAVGGPIGSAVGALLGQQIDRAVIGNGPRSEGPRLKELAVQNSSYGTAIPAIFGAMRVAGTVIWASDLVEQRTVQGGGKNRPGSATYSYSANFAVAFSSRPIARVGRIWADGNLLRGAAGDLKFDTALRIYHGQHDQQVDPLLASSEGPGLAPAYRGLAYAVFEGLQLAAFGNRIPSLTFELIEREEPVPLHEIIHSSSNRIITGETRETLTGYAVQGRDMRASIERLLGIFPLILRPDGDGMEIEGWFDAPIHPAGGPAVVQRGGRAVEKPVRSRTVMAGTAPSVALRYYDIERDFQPGLQRHGSDMNDDRAIQFELPACLSSAQAQRLAALHWLQQFRAKSASEQILPYAAELPLIGAMQAGSGEKITEIEHLGGCIKMRSQGWLDLENLPTDLADAGRALPTPDRMIGQTLLQLIDLPAVAEPLPTQPVIGVVAAGTGQGWRKAALGYYDGPALVELGRSAPSGAIGWLLAPLPVHSSHLVDTGNKMTVRVYHPGMDFPPGSGDPLHPDAPTLHIAGEILRYGVCEQTGPADFSISRLVRGCFGTEHQIRRHAVNSALTLLEKETVLPFTASGLVVDGSASIEAIAIGDPHPVTATISNIGLAVRPLPPCHVKAILDPEQGVVISWIRRSRLDKGWRDYADMPFDEATLAFDVKIENGATPVATYWVLGEKLEIPGTTVGEWGLPSETRLTIYVQQRGANALSLPAVASLVLR